MKNIAEIGKILFSQDGETMAIETLGEAYAAGWRINVRCAQGRMHGMKSIRECLERDELDLKTLMWTRGETFPLERLESRLKCPCCWSRRVAVWFDTTANVRRVRMVGRP